MKKIFLLCALIMCTVATFAQDATMTADNPVENTAQSVTNTQNKTPVFDRGVTIDLSTNQFIFKKIEFINLCNCAPYTLNIYGYDEGTSQWVFCGEVFLKGYNDDDSIKHTAQSRYIDTYKYFGVESTAPVALSFGTPFQGKGGKLCINVTENKNSATGNAAPDANNTPTTNVTTAPTADGGTVPGEFNGSVIDLGRVARFKEIEFKDYTKTGPHSLRVSVYDEQNKKWVYIGPIYLKGYGDDDDIDDDRMYPIGSFRYIGLEAQDGDVLKYAIESNKDNKNNKHNKKKKYDKLHIAVTQ